MERLLQAIVTAAANREKMLIRISGHGASGKSTFAKRLQQLLPDGQSQLLETDAYIIANDFSQAVLISSPDQGEEVLGSITACHPARHELASLRRDIMMFKQGLDFLSIDTPWSPSFLVKGNVPILIAEGMSTTFLEPELFDLSLYFYTDDDTELQRRLGRDTSVRGRNSEFIQQSHANRRAQYACYLHPYHQQFDIVINQSQNRFIVETCHISEN
ncbi:TPA: phosphoribulokinase [Streptococcus equi subsp. zooepidemicus]|nr:phosphoribulokinase [Streptococcus equi subsp. zooepidemicus]HEL0427781.1 phosphoribulokinase [Streptococcus equi subsp. zooepidemicus]HEL0429999.1 phosphoribulokinase [Streptococcus equi subsp. zooepidemicus]HEL0434079.1 phosphoribulokinase [Streptococcus equi subsp. zooepidemicus]HEL0438154.1 phosphoribulokinase [Streptococcus equi subsp. zooepidemicus]